MENIDLGLLVLRLAVGLTIAPHGAQKLFGWFGGYGVKGTGAWLDSMGAKNGALIALFAGLGEFFGGLGVAAGFLTPIAAVGVIAVMIGAIATAHKGKGFFNTNGGVELPLLIALGALGIAIAGPGAYSLSATLGF
jgi:putative oxidoreductase